MIDPRKFLSFLLIAAAIFLFLFFVLVPPVLAKIEISQHPSEIQINKEFTVNVSLTNISGSHHIGIGIHKQAGEEYFGLAKNDGQWAEMEDSNCGDLPLVTAVESSWSGQLTGKVEYGEKGFDGSLGDYLLRIVKYTTTSCESGGSSKSYSDEVNVALVDPNPPTPTPEPTNTPTPTPKLTPTPKSPTPTPTPKPPTSTPTSPPTLTPTPSLRAVGLTATLAGEVLGEEEASPEAFYPWEATQEGDVAQEATPSKRRILPFVFLGLGLTFLGGAAYSLWYTKLRWPEQGS